MGRVMALFYPFVVAVVVPQIHAFFKITELKSESQNQMSKFLLCNWKIKHRKKIWEDVKLCSWWFAKLKYAEYLLYAKPWN